MKTPKRLSSSPPLLDPLKYFLLLDKLNRRKGEIGLAVVLVSSLIAAGIKINKIIDTLTNPPRREIEFLPENFGLKHKDFAIKTKDNKLVSGWLIDPESNGGNKSKQVVILSHGYGMNRSVHPAILQITKLLVKNGIACILFDFENHGLMKGEKTSDDGSTTLGIKTEKNNLHAVVDYAKKLDYSQIRLFGISMGAASSLLVAAERDDIEGVVADSSFSDMLPFLTEKISKRIKLHPQIVQHALTPYLKGKGLYSYAIQSPLEAIKKLGERGVDVKLIHTIGDGITPEIHSEKLAKAYIEAYNRKNQQPKTWKNVIMLTEGIGEDKEQKNHCRSIDKSFKGYTKFAIDHTIRQMGKIKPKPLQTPNPMQIDGPNKASRPFKYTGRHRDSPNIRRVRTMKEALKTILFKLY